MEKTEFDRKTEMLATANRKVMAAKAKLRDLQYEVRYAQKELVQTIINEFPHDAAELLSPNGNLTWFMRSRQ